MGTFVTNLHVRGASLQPVVAALRTLPVTSAFVRDAPRNGWTSVFPELIGLNIAALPDMACGLSERLSLPVIAFYVHDSDVFTYWAYERGKPLDYYDSAPAFFAGGGEPPEGGNPDVMITLCPPETSTKQLSEVLQGSSDDFVFAEHRAAALANLLGIPEEPSIDSYAYLMHGEGAPGSLILLEAEGEREITL